MTRKNVKIIVKEGVTKIDSFRAKSGREAARILREKYGNLGSLDNERSSNPLPSLQDDLDGQGAFDL